MACNLLHSAALSVGSNTQSARYELVYDRLLQDGLEDGSSAGAIVIGQKEMFQAVSECLTKAGVTQDRILTNF